MKLFGKIKEKAPLLLGSPLFGIVLLILAILVNIFSLEVFGALFFITVICLGLTLCEDTSVTLLPFMMVAAFMCTCYDSFDRFIKFVPLAVPAIACIVYHFVRYKRKFYTGKTFKPLICVAVAVTLGGLGTLPAGDYFRPGALFYTFGLGFGMVGMYLLLKSRYTPDISLDENERREKYERLSKTIAYDFYLLGLLVSAMILVHYAKNISAMIENPNLVADFQPRNNFSTFLMFSLPFPFYFTMNTAEKRSGGAFIRFSDLHLLAAALMYGSIVISGSRGGLLFGSVEFIICFIYCVLVRGKRRLPLYLGITAAGVVLITVLAGNVMELLDVRIGNGFINGSDTRLNLLLRSIDDFKRNIVFGSGIGNTYNSDLFNHKKGALDWYHMYIAQVIGSFGSVGILAFGYSIATRFSLFLTKTNVWKMTLGFSYLGVFMMSMVNPGEFSPIPYEIMTVLLFVYLENAEGDFSLLFFQEK